MEESNAQRDQGEKTFVQNPTGGRVDQGPVLAAVSTETVASDEEASQNLAVYSMTTLLLDIFPV